MKKLLKNADELLSRMVVSGDNVMLLAAARSAILAAFKEADKADKETEKADGEEEKTE